MPPTKMEAASSRRFCPRPPVPCLLARGHQPRLPRSAFFLGCGQLLPPPRHIPAPSRAPPAAAGEAALRAPQAARAGPRGEAPGEAGVGSGRGADRARSASGSPGSRRRGCRAGRGRLREACWEGEERRKQKSFQLVLLGGKAENASAEPARSGNHEKPLPRYAVLRKHVGGRGLRASAGRSGLGRGAASPASIPAGLPPCRPAGGVREGLRNLAEEMNGARGGRRRRSRAAPREVEGGEDRCCGLGFESQPRRHCSRAPNRAGERRFAGLGSPRTCGWTGRSGVARLGSARPGPVGARVGVPAEPGSAMGKAGRRGRAAEAGGRPAGSAREEPPRGGRCCVCKCVEGSGVRVSVCLSACLSVCLSVPALPGGGGERTIPG